MSQPPSPGNMAAVDQAHAEASRFIDQMLTDGLSQLQSGMPLHELFIRLGGGLYAHRAVLSDTHMRVVLATAVGRLAVLHHEIEQLADQWAAAATNIPDNPAAPAELLHSCAAELRKLVDDHG